MITGRTETKNKAKIIMAASKIMADKKTKKAFAGFLIACILFSQSQALIALAGYDENSSVENFVTQSFIPKQTLLAADNQLSINWTNPDNALTVDLNSTDPASLFTFENSAMLINGYSSPINTSTPTSTPEQTASTTSADLNISAYANAESLTELPAANINTTSTVVNLLPPPGGLEQSEENDQATKIDLLTTTTSTPSAVVSDTENVLQTSEIKSDVLEQSTSSPATTTPEELLPRPEKQLSAPALEYNKFVAKEKKSIPATPNSGKIFLSFASQPLSQGQLVIEYALGDSSWEKLTTISLEEDNNNAKRQGYFSADLPESTLGRLDEIHIRLKIWAPEKSWNKISENSIFSLDGIWLEANYKVLEKNDDELAQTQLPTLTPEQFAHLEFFSPLAELFMPSDLSANPITVGSKNKSLNTPLLQMLPVGVSTTTPPTRQGQTIVYSDAYPEVDLEYQLKDTGLKENIILKNKSHPAKFRYLLNANQYDVIQTSPSQIEFYKKGYKGNILYKKFALTAPIMTDANNASSDRLVFQLKGNLVTLIPDKEWLEHATYPVIIDPSVDLSILNVSSFPVAGEYWTIGFTTSGQDDLIVTPGDQNTIDDMDFSSLTCDGVPVVVQVSEQGQITASNWSCDGIGEIKFFDKKTGHHHMIFNFGGVTQDAYNGANVWNGGAGDSNWSSGGNWSLGSQPGVGDDVVINTAATVNINTAATVNSLTVGVSGGGTASVLNFNYDAIGGSPLAVTGDLTVYGSANITHTAASSTSASAAAIIGTVNLSVGGNATIVGSINSDAKGYSMSHGPGTPNMINGNIGTGASHGGIGSKGDGAQTGSQGAAYGSSTAPTTLGSGGGKACGLSGTANDIGLWGGGAIKLNVTGTTTVSGTISATGSSSNPQGSCWNPGSGSGGSVYIITGKLAGAGTVSANGGSGTNISSGGGGRVAVYYTTDNSTVSFQAYGGSTRSYLSIDRYAGAGTVFKKSAAQTYGTLTISNNSYGGTDDNVFGLTPIISTSTFDSITISNSGYLNLNSSSAAISSTTSLTISSNSLYEAASGTTLSYGSLSWSGVILDSDGSFAVINQNQDLTIPAGGKLVLNVANATRTYNNLTVNGTYTHTQNTTATSGTLSLYKLDTTITGNLTVGASGSINADAKGYMISRGPGTPSSVNGNNGSGASHGGIGSKGDGTQTGNLGTIYGSSTAPTSLGSGGGKGCSLAAASGDTGLWGGGAIKLTVSGTTTVAGTISANGSASEPTDMCWYPGSGSGGSIYLTTGLLTGSGTISANGGGTSNISAGGGGRIATYYNTDTSTILFQAYGGGTRYYASTERYAGAGTIYKKSSAQTYGSLIIANNDSGGSDETVLGLTPIINTTTLDSLTISNSAYTYLSSASTTLASTTSLTISSNGLYETVPATTLNYGSLSWSGILVDSGGSLAVLNQNQDLTISTSSKVVLNQTNTTRTYNNLTVNGIYTHSYNSTATSGSGSLYKLNLTVNNNLTVGPSGTINVDTKGYPGGQGTGAGVTNNKAGGGGYGGTGGNGISGGAGGDSYGSSTAPTALGSGGGNSGCGSTGGSGGGAIIINVTGTSTINGGLSANGGSGSGSCWNSGGGSGGSIFLTTNSLMGSGSVQAQGGNGIAGGSASGSGSGGRIAILSTSNLSSVSRNANGGTIMAATAATAGTVYPTDFPNISTENVTDNITGTSVTGNGTISSINYYAISQHGHVWSTWVNPTISNINLIDSATGGTATSTKFNQGAVTNAFDNSTSTFWGSSEGFSYDIEYDFATTTVINKYVIISSNSGGDSPKDWQFQAWNGSSWVSLQTITSQTGWSNYESRAFTLVNTTPYIKYRLYISANNGGGWTRVAELQLMSTGSDLTTKGATSTPGSYTSAVTGLSTNTAYHIRSYTTTIGGVVYGNDVSFSTGSANNPPNAPSSLGPNYFVSNLWTATTTPTFTFNLTDPEGSDTVKYRLMLDNDSNYSSPIIDYTSAIQSQGAASFMVGQAAGSGSYAVGSQNQTLSDNSSYYWKVQNIDSSTASSAFTPANSGSIAFKVDSTNPIPGTIDFYSVNPESISLSPLGASDSGSGIASYLFTNHTRSTSNGPIVSNFWNETGLTPNTQYTYSIMVTDALGQSSTTATASQYTLANVPSNPTTTVISNSSILVSWNNNLNPAGTEYYAENSTSAFNSGWITATSTLFTGLTCGTSYSFHVRARNILGTQTNYSVLVSPSASPCNNNPSLPSSLGNSQYINGGWANQANPGLNFTLSDSDASDTIKYRIQISTTSDFTGLIIDYTSPLLSQGGKTFTVGQATSTGIYTVGFSGQNLTDTSSGYYWRVMATDNSNAASSWATANSGSVAFKLDTVAPNAGTLSLAGYTTNAVTVSFTGGTDTDSGLGSSPYSYYNTINWNGSGNTDATTWTNSGLTAGTYTYKARVTDNAGNYTETPMSGSVTVAGNGGGGNPWDGSSTEGFSVFINQNDSLTNTNNVTLQLTGQPGTSQMMISNLADFSGASQEAYTTTKSWDICQGLGSCNNGTYTVYAKFYNASNQNSGTVSDVITYQILNTLFPGTISSTAVSTSSVSVLISGSADATYGLAINPYTFVNRSNNNYSATSSVPSWINTNLSPNTQYSYYTIVGNTNGDFGITADISAYTLANTPTNVTTSTITSTAIGLTWQANGNPAGTEYQILNQTTNTSSSWITSTSTTVSGLTCATAYAFKVKARNANGTETSYTPLTSQSTADCPVTPPAPPSGGGGGTTTTTGTTPSLLTCPDPAIGQFTECFYNDTILSSVAATGTAASINYDWGSQIPKPGVSADNFSVRWQGNFDFEQGNYQFTATTDDGVRLYIDNELIIDQWNDHSATTYKKTANLSAGSHLIEMNYYENRGSAVAKLSWKKSPILVCPTPANNAFTSCFYDSTLSSGQPVLFREDREINFDWGGLSPDSAVPTDNFSANWNGYFNFNQGNYQFTATADDGIRLYIDNQLIIDQWHDQSPTTYKSNKVLDAGRHLVRLEYYENYGGAVAKLTWKQIPDLLNCPGAGLNNFTACYYNGKSFSELAATSTITSINYDWGNQSPDPDINSDLFSARYSGMFFLEEGDYNFTAIADDGIKLFIDGETAIDQWRDQAPTSYTTAKYISPGWHLIQLNYYENYGGAVAKLSWQKIKNINVDKIGNLNFSDITAKSIEVDILYADPEIIPNDTVQILTNLLTGEVSRTIKNQKASFSNLQPNTFYLFKATVFDNQGRQIIIPNAGVRTSSLAVEPINPQPLPPNASSTPPVVVITTPPTGTVLPPSPTPPQTETPHETTPPLPDEKQPNPIEPILNFGQDVLKFAVDASIEMLNDSRVALLAVSQPLLSLGGVMQKIKDSPRVAVGISALTLAPASFYLEFSLASHGLNLNAAGSMADIWLKFLQWLYALLSMFGFRTKRRYWGTVYDSESKQPLDPVIVELIDQQSGKMLEQNITDMHGRFGFLDRPGTFVIRASKTNYRFPSQNILGKTDLVFDNLYHGELIQITAEGDIITPNIPMDPMAFDWNQMDKQRVVKINPRFEYVLHIILQTLFWSGALFVFLNFLLKTDLFNTLAILIYLAMALMRQLIPHTHLWGRIVFNNGLQAKDLLLELHPIKIPNVVTGRAITATSGKFFLKAMPGKYILSVKKITGDTNQILYKQDVTVDKNGVVNEIIHL